MWQGVIKNMEARMQKTLSSVQHEFATIRTGRASISLFDSLRVLYYGTPTPLKQLANISTPEPRLVIIQPWDAGCIKDVEKAILTSQLGLQPAVEGKMIRIVIPPLSKERREEMARIVKKMTEEGKVALRTIRRDGNDEIKKLEKEKKITEDESFKAQDQIQKLTDRHSKLLDDASHSKEKELITV
jgi:ribosome recycling factor